MKENVAERLLHKYNDFEMAEPLVDVEGMSSPRVCNLLNRLVAHLEPGERYLEIGCWRGLTLLSAAYGNLDKVCIACDKFRFFGRWTGFGYKARAIFLKNLARYRQQCAYIHFHHTSSERLFRRSLVPPPIGVYFFDGDHSYRGTYFGIAKAVPLLSPRAYIVVDDWRDEAISRATRDALRDARLRILWERELSGGYNSKEAWWNGIGLFFVERPDDPRTQD